MRRSDLIRRLFIPGLIIVVGLTIAWWSAERKNAEAEAARAFVRDVCLTIRKVQRVQNGIRPLFDAETPYGELGDRFGNKATLEKLGDVLRDTQATKSSLRVRIRPGDLPGPFGDGSATHIAVIYIDNTPELVLRLQFTDRPEGPRTIIGHALPDHAM